MRFSSISRVTAPTELPVSMSEAKKSARVDHDYEDDGLARLVQMATDEIEMACNRSLVTQTWDLILPCFPRGSVIYLPRSPAASITSITYYDSANVSQTLTLATYITQLLTAEPSELHLKYGYSWPSTYQRPDAVTVRYVAGTAAASVPAGLKEAVLTIVGDLYDNRGSVITGTIVSEIAERTTRNLRAKYEIPPLHV